MWSDRCSGRASGALERALGLVRALIRSSAGGGRSAWHAGSRSHAAKGGKLGGMTSARLLVGDVFDRLGELDDDQVSLFDLTDTL